MRNFTLHPGWLVFMPDFERSICLGTISISLLAFYLMLTKTPKTAKSFAKYLMLLQTTIALVDINYGLLFCPITLFPVPGGLCHGILCTWFDLRGHVGHSLMFFTMSAVAIAIIYCFHYKHVSIARMVGGSSQSAACDIAFRIATAIVYLMPCLFELGRYRNSVDGPRYVKEVEEK
ncbi:hypothetical protein PRIPAC_77025 [Pristionchus pacificus]|uniref:G protein-coupled receptor n=1 Tax=Pristionchus pacificus TaxID=54126 RepID=A0A2A6CN99_PRIPA|nr:hypothetical protein PRIPAC_77025 [Pristionchus pacificus]|eukprot:PDM79674.1 G protein-coupled receptor [Pristionchus pacificus]